MSALPTCLAGLKKAITAAPATTTQASAIPIESAVDRPRCGSSIMETSRRTSACSIRRSRNRHPDIWCLVTTRNRAMASAGRGRRQTRQRGGDVEGVDRHQFLVGECGDVDVLAGEAVVAFGLGGLDDIADEPAVAGQVDQPASVLGLRGELIAAFPQHLARLFGQQRILLARNVI